MTIFTHHSHLYSLIHTHTHTHAHTGMTIFTKGKPNPWPAYFSHHEIFHVFVVMAGITVYFINWSIIRRSCNPYARYTDVGEHLYYLINR